VPTTAGAILRDAGRLAALSRIESLGLLIILVLLGTLIDGQLVPEVTADLIAFAVAIANVAVQHRLIRLALRAGGRTQLGSHFGRFFLLNIALTIVLLLGFALLVVPGLILSARLMASGPALIDGDLSVRESIEESWRETATIFWPLLLLVALLWVPSTALFAMAMALQLTSGSLVADAVLLNILFNAALIFSCFVAAAVHLRSAGGHGVAEIFA
jgi:hypothetical protein